MSEKLLLTPEEAAERLQISRSRVYMLMKSKQLRSVKIGKARRISVQALEDFIAQAERAEIEA